MGSNGIIHVMDRLLTPPELEPLLPNFCNTSYNVTSSVSVKFQGFVIFTFYSNFYELL